jgi:hypothetical protein
MKVEKEKKKKASYPSEGGECDGIEKVIHGAGNIN